jgi:hypothetical protein
MLGGELLELVVEAPGEHRASALRGSKRRRWVDPSKAISASPERSEQCQGGHRDASHGRGWPFAVSCNG